MDDAIAAARQSLAVGEPLVALPYVALRDDPPALALRGIAMAQLGDWSRARELLSRAARAFGPDSRVERGRCLLAEAEVALAQRDLAWSPLALHHALRSLKARGDHINVLHARILLIRRMLLLGDLTRALPALTALNLEGAPAALAATAELARAELALRRVQVSSARAALQRARRTAQRAGIPALLAEVNRMQRTLSLPAARLMTTRSEHTLRLGQAERLLASNQLVINGVQRCLSHGAYQVRMRRRPVLFSLLQTLGEHWPAQATREVLIARAFGSLRPNSSHRSRLRVEISRLRTAIRSLAQIQATPDGFKLAAHEGTPIAVLAPPVTGDDAALLALLSDGEAWPTSALALALPTSQRTVQRALTRLVKAGQVHCIGVGRMRRWVAAPAAETSSSWFLATAVVC